MYKEGVFKVENIKPKLSGGVRKIVDDTYKDRATFKESEDGEIEE